MLRRRWSGLGADRRPKGSTVNLNSLSVFGKRDPVVPMNPQDALDSATFYMIERGNDFFNKDFSVISRSESSVTFQNHQKPNDLGVLLLLLFFILPGLLYMLFGGKDVQVTLFVTPVEGGSRVTIGGDSNAGRANLEAWLRKQN